MIRTKRIGDMINIQVETTYLPSTKFKIIFMFVS
jgi:hypothetical protein